MDEDCINWTEHFGVNTEKRRTELDTSAFIGEKTKHDFIAFRFVVNFVKKKNVLIEEVQRKKYKRKIIFIKIKFKVSNVRTHIS
jgi:hypothetical protein